MSVGRVAERLGKNGISKAERLYKSERRRENLFFSSSLERLSLYYVIKFKIGYNRPRAGVPEKGN